MSQQGIPKLAHEIRYHFAQKLRMYYAEIRVDEKIAHLNVRVPTINVIKDIVLTHPIIHCRTLLCQITG